MILALGLSFLPGTPALAASYDVVDKDIATLQADMAAGRVDAVGLVGVIVGQGDAIQPPDVGGDHLGAQIRRGVDHQGGFRALPRSADEQGAARAVIAGLGGITGAPVAVGARHAA